ncbi:MAG: AAA family ATPase, partial [Desulfovibrio sp.]|nr:AAA family ATPase [Desulfovibrio sp.]
MATPPLAERLRPTSIEFFLGQTHLKERIEALLACPRLPSLLFFGPPGCGKSTLAILLAKSRNQRFLRLSAPETSLQNLRRSLTGFSLLILDELHRFSKSQQDFFLPLLESGELTLLATTTENPAFNITKQLLSRLQILKLSPLLPNDMIGLAQRGAQALSLQLPESVLNLLCVTAQGDGRCLLNLIEYTATLKGPLTIERVQKI